MKEVGFGTLNWVAVIIYLLAMLLIGVYLLSARVKVRIVSLPQVVACHLG